jgi:ankyrin repeat protein
LPGLVERGITEVDAHEVAARRLLAAGSNPNLVTGLGKQQCTALHIAAAAGNINILKALLQNGASIDAVSKPVRVML